MSLLSLRFSTVASVIALSALSPAGAWAQSAEPAASAEDDGIITVWGTRVEADNLLLEESDMAIRQADHLSDLLRQIPGVDVGGTHSLNTRINFRGLDDRDLNVFIDGALQTNYLYHHIGNLLINPDILESADIQLGTNSVTHGGLGGAIRFETKDAADLLLPGRHIGGRIAGGWNSNALASGSLTLYGQSGDLDLLAYYNRVDRGNFEDGSGRQTIGSDGITQNLLLKGEFAIASGHSLRLSYDRYWDAGDYTQRPDMGVLTNTAITGNILIPTEYRRESINAGYRGNFGDALDLSLTVYTNDMRLYRDESNPAIPRGIRTDRRVDADNWGVNLLAQSQWDMGDVGQTFTWGGEYFDQRLDYVPDVKGNAPSQIQTSESLALFVEDALSFGDGLLQIRPGLRYNHYALDLRTTGTGGSWDAVTWGLAGDLNAGGGLRLFASYTTLFRGPEPAEPFGGNAGVKIINPNLEPERGSNFEFGARWQGELGPVETGLTARYFRTHITNYIGEVPSGTGPGVVWDANIGTANIEGFELAANLRAGNFDLLAGFSSAVLDASRLTGADLTESLREIGDKLTADVAWHSDDRLLRIGADVQHVFAKPTASGDLKPAYTVVNLSGRWDDVAGIAGLSLTAGIDNLFDVTYTSHASRTGATFHPVFGALILNDVEPGRNFKITAALRF